MEEPKNIKESTIKYSIDAIDEENDIDNYFNGSDDSDNESSSISEIEEEEIIIGIDLGTTNSCVSIWRNGNEEIIPDEYGNRTIPSVVSFTNLTKYVGMEAHKQKKLNPENTYYEVKRLIGRKISDISVKNDLDFLTYKIGGDENDNVILQTGLNSKKAYMPEEIAAEILIKLKHMAEIYLKTTVNKAVITVPALFNDAQRQATKDAASIAGLECVRIINEPTAAALAYGLEKQSMFVEKELNVLVIDMGGGTLDVSLLNIADGVFDVLGSAGNTHLGGVDFDDKLMNYCINKFKSQYNINKLKNHSLVSLQKLKRSCENAKKMLSFNDKAIIAVKDFYDGKNLHFKITRKIFERICRDLFILCLKPIDDILKTCELEVDDIDEIILVGGATRMPLIQDNIRRFFRGKSPDCSVNPDEVVAVGAGIQAAILSGNKNPFSESIVLLDIIPLSLGVETIGGVMNILIPRNSTIPIVRKRKYTTDDDYQDEITVKIYEGERKMTKDNFFIGQFDLTGIEKAPRGVAEIEITFEIDINGIINVTAIDKKNNDNKQKITVNGNKGRLSSEQLSQLIKESEEMEMIDKLEREKKHYYYEIEDLCSNVIINIKNDEFKLRDNDKSYIITDIKKTIDWIKEVPYYKRDKKSYMKVIKTLKQKYGTLILKITHNSNKIKATNKSNGMAMTSVFGDDDDDDDETNDKIYEKIEDEEMGFDDNDNEEEKKTLKTMRNYLMDLCNNVFDIINDTLIAISYDEKIKLKDLIDDVLLWIHVKEKLTKSDYQDKIDLVDKNCNEIFDKYDNKLFYQNEIKQNINSSKDELEQLCYAIGSSIENNLFNINENETITLKTMITKTLDWLVEIDVNEKKAQITGKEYIVDNKLFKEKLDIITNHCNQLYKSMHNINILNNNTPKSNFDSKVTDTNVIILNNNIEEDCTNIMSGTTLADLMKEE